MKFIHSEHNILENDNIKRERQSYIEITSVISHTKFKKVKFESTSRESKKIKLSLKFLTSNYILLIIL